ncbi:XdhC family protein [Nocardioides luteus]|uniref:XdhC family protein n=1 Tax=Nocardioides luteus TaxID=1844 RepID=UPI0018CBCB54|nr:XdhC/CoxI family protein [Nocardioides luteus]MBG6096841.1 xanthine dehydrogenase accessory factor [Nocardioides luteus]
MDDILETLVEHWEANTPVALATVVSTFKSAPRVPGASLLVTPGGEVTGSVSGGCVEGAVYELATQVLSDGTPQLVRYGFSDADAFEIGLTCGGIVDIFVQRIDRDTAPWVGELAAAVRDGREVAVATVIEHPVSGTLARAVLLGGDDAATLGHLGDERLDRVVLDDARGVLRTGRSGTLSYGTDIRRQGEGIRVFVWSFAPPPRLIVFGAIDFAAALAEVGSFLGYRVTVCDARPIFATNARFPKADEVVVEWPHRYLRREAEEHRVDARTAICVLTHDAKFDVPVLEVALRLPSVGYVGAMGSRTTHADRLSRLVEVGISNDLLDQLHSPIGLDIGANTPHETALSIAAEILATRSRATGMPLRTLGGPIHGRTALLAGTAHAEQRESPRV